MYLLAKQLLNTYYVLDAEKPTVGLRNTQRKGNVDPSDPGMTGGVLGKLLLGQLQLGRVPHCRARGQEARELARSQGNRAEEGTKPVGTSKCPEQSQRFSSLPSSTPTFTALTVAPGNQVHFNQTLRHQTIRRE